MTGMLVAKMHTIVEERWYGIHAKFRSAVKWEIGTLRIANWKTPQLREQVIRHNDATKRNPNLGQNLVR